ncbi:MAG: Hpt domain-containing protein [Bacilli bacterium]|nr:Hpt domain-containing protein [Bacilli bacterium]
MSYRILIIGEEQCTLESDGFIIDFQPNGSLGDYDLAINKETGAVISCFDNSSLGTIKTDNLATALPEAIALIQKQEFDEELALEMLGGSKKIYANCFRLYLQEYNDLEDRLNRENVNGNYQAMNELVHKIKGFSLYLGAKGIHQLAMMLESNLSKGTNAGFEAFIRAHQRVCDYCRLQVDNV